MLRLIVLIASVANLNSVLTDASSKTSNADCGCGPKVKCGPNQVYEECPVTCPPRTCATKDIAFRCKEPLKPGDPDCAPPGCRCVEGYYKTITGECVLKEQCPQCKENEEYSKCPEQECREKTCDEVGARLPCYTEKKIQCGTPGCICVDNYVKGPDGVCIPKKNCPKPQCNANEEFAECPNKVCREKTCDDLGFELPCYKSDMNTTECGKPSCICKEGYVRNNNEECILKKYCPSCGGDPNAQSGCGTFCRRCTGNIPCPKICQRNKCECRTGRVYDETKKKCVLPTQCPKTCKENEEYQECPNRICGPKTCDDVGYPLSCYQSDLQNVTCGRADCICKAGFVKDHKGICVSARQCPSCAGDKNAWSGCGTYCTRCSNYKRKNIACILLCRLNSCDCRTGYLFDDIVQKKCVLPEDCPCGPNEVRSDCANSPCVLEHCSQKDVNTKCKPDKTKCKRGCLCAEGFRRNDDGVCIPKNKCPTQCGPNEVYASCGISGCGKWNCSQLAEPELCIDVLPDSCVGSCICKPGRLRNLAGECVLPDKCPDNEVCPKKNEYYERCPSDNCPPSTCETPNTRTLVACTVPSNPNDCIPACLCKPGFYKNSKGECVTLDECHNCGSLEVYSDCANAGCEKRNCSQLAQPAVCIDVSEEGCRGGCVCKSGLLRNAEGCCVTDSQCPSKEVCPKPHQYYDQCPPSCPARQCGIDDRLILCKPPSPTAGCNKPSCRCEEGYYMDIFGNCVTFDKCQPKCGPNKVYSECGNNACLSTCAEPDKIASCSYDPSSCKPGCVCAEGLLKDGKGNCVPRDKCPKPKCGENEVYDTCPASCPPRTCDTSGRVYKCPPQPQPGDPQCKPDCRCADNYYSNEEKKCVLKEQCKPKCGPNEVQSECGNNGCLSTCAEPNLIAYCSYDPSSCKPGCVCAVGFLKDGKGNCVPRNKCSKPKCGPNQVYSECGNNACLSTCAEPDKIASCSYDPSTCKPGCVCAEGLLKDGKGNCVPRDECPPKKDNKYCLLAPEVGLCKALMPKYYYDPCKKDCILFNYGGCGGNDNKFDTKSECLKNCSSCSNK